MGNVGGGIRLGNVFYGATVVIGSKDDVFFFVVMKSREALLSLAVVIRLRPRRKVIGNFMLYAPPLKSCDQRRMYHGGVIWRME